MKAIRKPSYPALACTSIGKEIIDRKDKKGFFIFFIAIIVATVTGMVVFLLFVSTELSAEKGLLSVENGDVRALFITCRPVQEEGTAPFFKEGRDEKNKIQATPCE
ncbi:MAG: hypothetical protein PHW88_01405 [Bacteroidales bacterium]|jgi:hypothetical protein|nr:hypothetical protein [Bacteroidales bacterium]MDD2771395.1 hypothetical protein [Bacteroidales bacterium]MDD3105432.1 hypothetical protein [Bacteroidales bacterium]MDD3549097.1 hypothetical protein [Bacteroidales bacterium]MDD4064862.1 hypothetical protein [Bacteroidales bacterium]